MLAGDSIEGAAGLRVGRHTVWYSGAGCASHVQTGGSGSSASAVEQDVRAGCQGAGLPSSIPDAAHLLQSGPCQPVRRLQSSRSPSFACRSPTTSPT